MRLTQPETRKEPYFLYGNLCQKKSKILKLRISAGIRRIMICLEFRSGHVSIEKVALLCLFRRNLINLILSISKRIKFLYRNKLLDKFVDQHDSQNGTIALYSLKNPSCPEYIYIAPSGVMCLDFNTKYPYMIVAGLVCGNVAVYNMQLKTNKPTYLSSMKNGKHSDIVWKVTII